MRFNVAQLLREPVGSSRQYVINEHIGKINDEVTTTRPLVGHVKLVNTGKTILALADVETEVELTCSRCIELFTYRLRFRFEEEFHPTIDIDTGLPKEAPTDEGAFTIGQDHVLDLDEAVRQYALVALPMAPLCLPECAGLCPQCGQNLNQGRCSCQTAATDSRWEALRALAQEREPESEESSDRQPEDDRPSGRKE